MIRRPTGFLAKLSDATANRDLRLMLQTVCNSLRGLSY